MTTNLWMEYNFLVNHEYMHYPHLLGYWVPYMERLSPERT